MSEPVVLGVDIGGTKIAMAVVTPQGEVLTRDAIPTAAEQGFDDGMRRITALAERSLSDDAVRGRHLAAIGIGCTGPVDPMQGTINNPYTLPTWDGVNIVDPLQDRFGLPVALENDADAAAMGEVWLGAGRGGRVVVMVTVGTGIGGALIVNGEIYRGVGGAHPEIGHHCIDPAGPPCYCGIRGCWEAMASGPAIAAAARERMPDRPAESITGAGVIALARAGDPIAEQVVARAAHALGLGVFNIINLYVPEIVVLGGGVMEAYDLFEPTIRQLVACDTMAPIDGIYIRRAALGNDAGILGAARIALNLLGPAGSDSEEDVR
jgi:glucokinase